MINRKSLKIGMPVLVRASVFSLGNAEIDSDLPFQLAVQIEGARPPFTRSTFTIGLTDIDSIVTEDQPEPPPLKFGDKVRDGQGVEWEVSTPPRAVEKGLMKVGLWNNELGYDTDFVENLEVIG